VMKMSVNERMMTGLRLRRDDGRGARVLASCC
jgi:hypothetical protein